MLLIDCPWCGPRDQSEFACGGEAHIQRPADPDAVSDAEWADYQFFRTNPRGWHAEQWCHSHGCGRWFNAERHTVTYEIRRTWRLDDAGGGDDRGETRG